MSERIVATDRELIAALQEQVKMLDAVVEDHQAALIDMRARGEVLVEVVRGLLEGLKQLTEGVPDENGVTVLRVDLGREAQLVEDLVTTAALHFADVGEGN